MTILLGFRLALAGGREGLARAALVAAGIATGVPLILLALSALPIMQNHIDRLAWHRTTATSPATAPDHAMWLAVTDRYAGQDIIRVQVAALGPRPPVPPGIARLPGPGERVLSPALASLVRSVPADQLGDRFPGRDVGQVGPDGLIVRGELVALVGRTPAEMLAMPGAIEIAGIEQPGLRLDLAGVWGVLFGLIAALVVGPVAVFVAMTVRVGGPRRDLRFAAVRLAGATRLQTAVLAATETVVAAVAGTLLGWLLYVGLRPVAAGMITLGHGSAIFTSDVAVPVVPLIVVLAGVPVLAVLTTLVALRPAQMTPLGVRHRRRRRPPSAWRLAPIVVGLAGAWYSFGAANDPDKVDDSLAQATLGQISMVSVLITLIGFFLTGAWVCMWVSRGMARVSRSAPTLIVARRIAADPYSTFRMVGGAAVAMYVATGVGFSVAASSSSTPPTTLDRGVVAVHTQGVAIPALMTGDAVVARVTPGQMIVVSCSDLARVTSMSCPLPIYQEGGADDQVYLRAEDLFTLPYPNPTSADTVFQPQGFSSPGPLTSSLPVQTVFVRTDGSTAAEERVRTLAAGAVPQSRSKVSADLAGGSGWTGVADILPYAMVFILILTACSLTVSVITGVLERRRPFAQLRASGVSLGELRRIVLLETGAPLAVTLLLGVGLAVLQSLILIAPSDWILPSGRFLAGLAVGAVAAYGVSLIALPFMSSATRLDAVRYE
ncbi:FtsX-like permease family protein [Paractinoplanes globisporus]|uniref:FtsX-like permease family protein n=1 Tax=Paractinoplanes globisporus TaxID=113565 RepID=A0ABW6WQU1_9ACTN|nr:FtsX-like permease family protein [Actinoplanes globisporus]